MRDDRPGRADRQLLARDLEDERPEGIEWRKLVHPGPRAEVRPRVDQPREHRVGLPKEVARLGIGNRGSLAGWSLHAHRFSSPVETMLSNSSSGSIDRTPANWEAGSRSPRAPSSAA